MFPHRTSRRVYGAYSPTKTAEDLGAAFEHMRGGRDEPRVIQTDREAALTISNTTSRPRGYSTACGTRAQGVRTREV